jgi:hypothetical protein
MCNTIESWCLVYVMLLCNCAGYTELSSRAICDGCVEKVQGGRSRDSCAMKVTLHNKCGCRSQWLNAIYIIFF